MLKYLIGDSLLFEIFPASFYTNFTFRFRKSNKLKSCPVNMKVLYMILLFVYLQSDTKDVIVHA